MKIGSIAILNSKNKNTLLETWKDCQQQDI